MIDGFAGLARFPSAFHAWHSGAFARTFESRYYQYFKENILLIMCVEFYNEIEPDYKKNDERTIY